MDLLGLDLGTSSLKALVMSPFGDIRGVGQASYPILTPQDGWAEQDPEAWWKATQIAVSQALSGLDARRVGAVGLSGQMHGLVLSLKDSAPLYPAVIWADGRTSGLLPRFSEQIPKRLWATLGGRPATGFAGLTLFWFQSHHPELLERSCYTLQPKDWLRLKLTGEVFGEATDASASWLMDVGRRIWNSELLGLLNLPGDILPPLLKTEEKAGTLSKAAAEALGLQPGIPVGAGAADQAAAAVGNGVLEPGITQILLGTGGQILQVLDNPDPDSTFRTHLFCHAPGNRWYRLAAILNSGLALNWAREILGVSWPDFFSLAAQANDGARGLLFLPHLIGERTPHMNPNALGAWIGLSREHTRADLARAAIEGVCFAFREALESLGRPAHSLKVGGGGTKHPLWTQVLANVLEQPLEVSSREEASACGAALLGGLAAGAYSSYKEVHELTVGSNLVIEPSSKAYAQGFARFKEAYQLLESFWPSKNDP